MPSPTTLPSCPLRRPTLVLAALATLWSGGCASRPKSLPEAKYDPDSMATSALRDYDRNNNGLLEASELDACPGLKSALVGIDTNRDGKLSREELTERFAAYQSIGTIAVPITVTLDGNPLAGATLTFTPESCMGGAIQAMTGKSDETGTVGAFEYGGNGYAGLHAGLYKVTVSRLDASGTETIPARYSTQATLGCEVYGGRGSSA